MQGIAIWGEPELCTLSIKGVKVIILLMLVDKTKTKLELIEYIPRVLWKYYNISPIPLCRGFYSLKFSVLLLRNFKYAVEKLKHVQ